MRKKLNVSEQHIENSINEYVPVSERERERILGAAAKSRTISLRINETVLESIKRKAAEEGLPYQTFITSILFKYCSNRLIDDRAIRKVVDVLR
jgi:predicted DNA binding CopG/RHH family protein